MNDNVDKIIKENHLVSRPTIVENIQHVGRRLKKAEKKREEEWVRGREEAREIER